MPIYEAKTVAAATEEGLQALQLAQEDACIEVLQAEKKGFLGFGRQNALVQIEARPVVVVEETMDVPVAIEQEETVPDFHEDLAVYVTSLIAHIDPQADVRVTQKKKKLFVQIESNIPGLLIGKHGRMVNALQTLAQAYMQQASREYLVVQVDVGNYREKRHVALQRLAEQTARKVQQTKQPVYLEPMPSFERKQVHAVLSKHPAVDTYSEGKEPYRYLVVELRK